MYPIYHKPKNYFQLAITAHIGILYDVRGTPPRGYKRGYTMTAVEIGQAMWVQVPAMYQPPRLRLSDAMAAANGEDDADEERASGAVLVERRVGERSNGGIRFQRCGGGRRIIRRQRRGS